MPPAARILRFFACAFLCAACGSSPPARPSARPGAGSPKSVDFVPQTAKGADALQEAWTSLSAELRQPSVNQDAEKTSRKWSSWVLSDPEKRVEMARRILAGPAPEDVEPSAWERFRAAFRDVFLLQAAERYDVSLPEGTQAELVDLLHAHAPEDLRSRLGDAILENMRRQERISLSSVRAIGRLGAADAVSYLRLFVDFDVPDVLRAAVLDSLGELNRDPDATQVLFGLARPLFAHWAEKKAIDERERARALQALAGLGRARACHLPKTEYSFLSRVFDALAKQKQEDREPALGAVARLMLCADPARARTRIPKSLLQSLNPH